MKIFFVFILLFSAFACSAQDKALDNRQQEIVFLSVNVIPMDKERLIENQTVIVQNGKITAIGDAAKIKYNKNALVIDAKDKYLMPGLAEMHAHVPQGDDFEAMKRVLNLFALNGVTTIRGMLGHPRHIELRSKIQNGEIFGPRFFTSGPSFNGFSVKSPEEGAEMVRNQKKAGYDFLKLHPGLSREKFDAIVKAAKEVNIPFAGHVSAQVGVWRAVEAGYATIDHLDGFVESLLPNLDSLTEQQIGLFGMFSGHLADTSRIPALMKALREKNIWVVPTQALAERWFAPDRDAEMLAKEPEMVYMTATELQNWTNTKKNLLANPLYQAASVKQFIEVRRKLIKACYQNGVGLLLGSDAPQVFDVPGFSVHHELRYLVDAGLSPYQALCTGTINVARFYKRKDMGIIQTGAVSDLILLNGNPLTDITQSKNIEGVVLGNHWLSKAYIEQELKKLKQ